MLPSELLADYAENFFGFGTWEAKIWFIGIEEGGGGTEEQVQRRLNAWEEQGKRELEDAPQFYQLCGCQHWHGSDATLQPTWKQLIRIHMLARGIDCSAQACLEYQRTRWGTSLGGTCLAELFPLASPSTHTWNYDRWSPLPWLRNRSTYQNTVLLSRATLLQRRIEQHRPPIVIFYGSSWHAQWGMIARAGWEQAIQGRLMGCERDGTAFYVTRHPVRESDAYFHEIGEFLLRKHGEQLRDAHPEESSGSHPEPGWAVATPARNSAPHPAVHRGEPTRSLQEILRAASAAVPDKLDWASAIGLFIINFGMLDWKVFESLESRMAPAELAKIKKEYFQVRITRIRTFISEDHSSPEHKQAFAKFFACLGSLRELRNHIAHGHMLLRVVNEGDPPILTLSLPKNLDATCASDSRHVDFKELTAALTELTALIEESSRLFGPARASANYCRE